MQIADIGTALVFSDATPEEKKRLLAAAKQPKPEQHRTLTRKQVAEILHIHSGSVKRYDRAGILHPIRITARTLRYNEAEVLELLSHREGADDE